MIKKPVTYNDILALIRIETGVTMGELRGTKGKGNVPKVRHLLNYMARKHTMLNCREIARYIVKDRTTVINSVNTTLQLLEKDPWFKELHDKIDALIIGKYTSAENFKDPLKVTEKAYIIREEKKEPEPVKFERPRAEYSNNRLYDY